MQPLGMTQRLPLLDVTRQSRPALSGIAAACRIGPGEDAITVYPADTFLGIASQHAAKPGSTSSEVCRSSSRFHRNRRTLLPILPLRRASRALLRRLRFQVREQVGDLLL